MIFPVEINIDEVSFRIHLKSIVKKIYHALGLLFLHTRNVMPCFLEQLNCFYNSLYVTVGTSVGPSVSPSAANALHFRLYLNNKA